MKKHIALGLLFSVAALFNSLKAIETPFTLFQTGLEASAKADPKMKVALAALYDLLPATTPVEISLKNKLATIYTNKFSQRPQDVDLSSIMPRIVSLLQDHKSKFDSYVRAAGQTTARLTQLQQQHATERTDKINAEKSLTDFIAKFGTYSKALNNLLAALKSAQDAQVVFGDTDDAENMHALQSAIAALRSSWSTYEGAIDTLESEPGISDLNLSNLRSGALRAIVDGILNTHEGTFSEHGLVTR